MSPAHDIGSFRLATPPAGFVDDPYPWYAALRRHSPVHPLAPDSVLLTRYDDVFFASRHPHIFSSAAGITIPEQTPELSEYFGSMIVMDDPRHQRLRSMVSRAFTPKVVARIETSVRDHLLVAELPSASMMMPRMISSNAM